MLQETVLKAELEEARMRANRYKERLKQKDKLLTNLIARIEDLKSSANSVEGSELDSMLLKQIDMLKEGVPQEQVRSSDEGAF